MKFIKFFLRSFYKFGFGYALSITFKYFTKNTNSMSLPGIRHSFALRGDSSDIPTFHQVFLLDEYNIRFSSIPKLIIDGGSNIGLFSIKMKNMFPDAKIICIEPDPENFEILRHNLAPYSNMYFENSGLWENNTNLKVYDKFNAGKWAMVVEEDVINGTIPAISLNYLCDKYSITYLDLLKLDVESSEKKIFAENYEGWLVKVKMIIIELHDGMVPDCSKPFFVAINKTFNRYSLTISGENIVIMNEDLN